MNQNIKFTEEEDERCRQVIELFADFLVEKQNICIARAEGCGYIVLLDITGGYFESSRICSQAEALYKELIRIWEVEYLFRTGMEHGCSDFETSEEALTEEQRAYWEEKRSSYRSALERILQTRA